MFAALQHENTTGTDLKEMENKGSDCRNLTAASLKFIWMSDGGIKVGMCYIYFRICGFGSYELNWQDLFQKETEAEISP